MHRQSFFLVPLICLSSALWAAPATVNVEVLQDKLDHPWALAFLPDNHGMLITLRGGELRHWQAGKGLSAPLSGVPDVWAHGQGGLLDVVLAPDFAQSRRIWLSYSEVGDDGKAGTAVGYGRLSDDLSKVTDFRTVFRQMPKLSTGNHFGGRLVFDGKGYLFIALGENNQRPTAQDLDKLQGKLVRLTDQGEIPDDNPFIKESGVRAEIWSYGIRNPQGMAMNPWSNALWLKNMARAVVMKLISRKKAKTTAGRWQPGESTIQALRYRKRKGRSSPGPSNLFFTGKIRPL